MRPAEAAARVVPDEMVRTFAACGTPDQVREWVELLWQRANSMLILPPSWGLVRHNWRKIRRRLPKPSGLLDRNIRECGMRTTSLASCSNVETP